jgi:heat shock protein HspQ
MYQQEIKYQVGDKVSTNIGCMNGVVKEVNPFYGSYLVLWDSNCLEWCGNHILPYNEDFNFLGKIKAAKKRRK